MSSSTTETPLSLPGPADVIIDPPASTSYLTATPAAPSPSAALVTYDDRHRSIEMIYLGDSISLSAGMLNCTIGNFVIYFIFVGTPMSTSTAATPMLLSDVIADPPASINYPTARAAPSPSTGLTTVTNDGSAAPSLAPAVSPPASAGTDRFPSAPFEPRSPTFPFREQRSLGRRPVNELMERMGTPPVVRSSHAFQPGTAAAGWLSPSSVPGSPTSSTPGSSTPTPTPTESAPTLQPSMSPAPTSSSAWTVPGSHPSSARLEAERGDNRHTSLSSADGTSIAIPGRASSPLYMNCNTIPAPCEVSGLIQGLNMHELFEIVHPGTLREWEAVSGPKVIVFIANDTVTTEIHHRVTLIRKALIAIFPDIDPVIGSAAVCGVTGVTHQPAFPFLIHQIPEPYALHLMLHHSWTVNGSRFLHCNLRFR